MRVKSWQTDQNEEDKKPMGRTGILNQNCQSITTVSITLKLRVERHNISLIGRSSWVVFLIVVHGSPTYIRIILKYLSYRLWHPGQDTMNLNLLIQNGKLQDWFFFPFIFIIWRLITLQYCSGFVIHWHESAMDLHVFPIPIPPPTSFSTRFLWVFPVHQAWALVSRIQPGLVICFTLDNIYVSMLFYQNIPP